MSRSNYHWTKAQIVTRAVGRFGGRAPDDRNQESVEEEASQEWDDSRGLDFPGLRKKKRKDNTSSVPEAQAPDVMDGRLPTAQQPFRYPGTLSFPGAYGSPSQNYSAGSSFASPTPTQSGWSTDGRSQTLYGDASSQVQASYAGPHPMYTRHHTEPMMASGQQQHAAPGFLGYARQDEPASYSNQHDAYNQANGGHTSGAQDTRGSRPDSWRASQASEFPGVAPNDGGFPGPGVSSDMCRHNYL